MKNKKLLALLSILCLFAGKVVAQSNDRRALRGIGPVGVEIALNSNARGGLSEDRLETTAELGLRRNGIPTGSVSILLTVEVSAVDVGVEDRFLGYAAYIEVGLNGVVTVSRNDVLTEARFWEKGTIITGREDTFERQVREIVEEFIDEFSNDYLAVNPK